MGLTQTLYTGVSGLSTQSDGMGVVANNIANANSKGFKRDRAEFEDMIQTDGSGGRLQDKVGRGAKIKDIRTIHSQGNMTTTDNLTDLAIQGGGMFVLNNPEAAADSTEGRMYTRAGSFIFDREGYLADVNGARVQGYEALPNGQISSRIGDFRINTNAVPPHQTEKLRMDLNLDARSKVIDGDFDPSKPDSTSNFGTSAVVYDSHGRTHQVSLFFKRATDGEESTWKWYAMADGKEVVNPEGELHTIASGELKFNNKGELAEQITEKSEANFAGGAALGQVINFDFGQISTDEVKKQVGGSTCLAAKSGTNYHTQDGFESGIIKAIRVDPSGVVRGIYTNGQNRSLGAVALATFENMDGLRKGGRNTFFQSLDSGPPKVGMAQTGNRGTIWASTLEESNVDIAQEFVNMILSQRAFQANSRSITTTDTMIEEILNLKR
jgi:flagellar hook protein FlgE